MQKRQTGRLMLAGALLLCVLGARSRGSVGQQTPGVPPQTHQPGQATPTAMPGPDDGDNPFRDKMEAQRARLQTSERRKRMVADTDRLLLLATELKAEVDKTTKDEMSVTVIRKAADIERLAHDVKERMKG